VTFNAGSRILASYLNQAVQLIKTTTLSSSAAFVDSPTITGFAHVRVLWQARTTSGNLSDFVELRFNGDTGNNYGWQTDEGQSTTASATGAAVGAASIINVGRASGGGAAAGHWGGGSFDVVGFGQAGSGHQATVVGTGFVSAGVGATQLITGAYGGNYTPSAGLTAIRLLPIAGSFAIGSSFSFYGYN
jgi:hypothetical protein